jgi:glycosyltransferase involved in cell wall biosynthesis
MSKIASFNNEKTLIAITSFPNPKDGQHGSKEFNAVGWHSQKTVRQLSKHAPVIVMAEQRDGTSIRQVDNNTLVKRIWKKGNPFSFIGLFRSILKLDKIQHIFVQFEFNVFGGIIPNLTLLMMLTVLRLLGRSITFELHQVITDIALLKKHINITNPILQHFFNISLGVFYRILGLVANDIIVFEEELKTRLSHYVPVEKIHVLSLSVESKEKVSQKKARSLTNLPQDEFVLLVFGFINGYKGIDWILKALKDYKDKKVRLVIAGGENPYLKDQPHYQKFYKGIVNEAKKHAHVTLTGFVPDSEIANYFGASDLVVMPYEVFMAASGPFSLALSYGKPVILSDVLSDYAQSEDFNEALQKSHLNKEDIFFKLTSKSLITLIEKAHTSPTYHKNLTRFANTLADLRSIEVVTKRLYSLMTSTSLTSPRIKKEKSLSLR